MAGTSKLTASALVGGLALLVHPVAVGAQRLAPVAAVPLPVVPAAPALAAGIQADPGGIAGVVRNDAGDAVPGAVVSVVGAMTTFAVTDARGRFELPSLAPGSYLVRASSRGHVAAKSQTVDVRSNSRAASSFVLRRVDAGPTILAAGIGGVELPQPADAPAVEEPAWTSQPDAASPSAGDDDHSETAWRLRRARRGVLRDASLPDDFLWDDDDADAGGPAAVAVFLGRAMASPARAATSFFADTPFSGQVDILTTNSFDGPEQLRAGGLARGIAYAKVGAPVGDTADWTVRGAVTQADIASWIVAGAYKTRAGHRHAYDLGLSYSTQSYAGGNPLALREVTDGSRNVGTVYAFETFTIAPALALTYGARYARYDYLEHRDLVSPRAAVLVKPFAHTRLSAGVSSRADAPGAEEFMPPSDGGIWLPPQRTFSSAAPGRPLRAERTTQVDAELERDFGAATVGVRAFRQHVDQQMVTVFGADVVEFSGSKLGHYMVGTAGDVDATGATLALRSSLGPRIRGSVAYSQMAARMDPAEHLRYIMLLAASAIRPAAERTQDVTASIEADVPETATRVLVLYRVGNGYARPGDSGDGQPRVDSRFDVQLRQSLPFMNFSNARWEMLVAVRNFFRDIESDRSAYDELLAVRPPKRIVGGVTLRF